MIANSKPKKILIATPLFPPDIGGPATYSAILKEELPKHGFAVTILSFGEVRHLPKIVRHLAYFWQTYRLGRKADLIYALDPVSVGMPAAWAAKLSGKRFLVKIVGDYAWEQGRQRFGVNDSLDEFVHKKNYRWFVRRLKKVQTWVAGQAERVIVPSEYLKGIIGAWGVNPEKISVVYNAVETVSVAGDKISLRQKYGLNGLVLVTAGRLVPWKGISGVIDVIPDLLNQISDLKLVVVGDGPLEAELKKQVAESSLDGRVIFTGRLPQLELLEQVKAADIFILNSSYEGFSHLLLEVMTIGTPIIATRVGGNGELISHNTDGILIASGNNLELKQAILFLRDETRRNILAAAGLKKVDNFSVPVMIDNLIKFL